MGAEHDLQIKISNTQNQHLFFFNLKVILSEVAYIFVCFKILFREGFKNEKLHIN